MCAPIVSSIYFIMSKISAMYMETKIMKYSNPSFNSKFMTEKELEERDSVNSYVKNHCKYNLLTVGGRNLMNQVSSQSILEDEVVEQLKSKKTLLAQLEQLNGGGENSEKIKVLEDEIDQLKAFHMQINENRAVDTGSYKYPKRDK